jgi:hypothetical protein
MRCFGQKPPGAYFIPSILIYAVTLDCVNGLPIQTTDRAALKETYREITLKVVPEKPYPTLPPLQTILNELATKNPKAKTARPEDFVDRSFVKKRDDEKFFDRFTKGKPFPLEAARNGFK